MSEPEELLIEGAHLATRVARDAWRRWAVPEAPLRLPLRQVRIRLELFASALCGQPVTIAAADPPAPASWLARMAHRAPVLERATEAWPGTDGSRVYLPPALDASAGAGTAIETYRLLAIQQAVRVVRGSAAIALALESDEIRDRFLVADAVATDQWIAREAPGLVAAMLDLRRQALAARPAAGSKGSAPLEILLRRALARDPRAGVPGLPAAETAADALAWAQDSAGQRGGRYAPTPPAWYWGRPLTRPAGALSAPRYLAGQDAPATQRSQRVAEMRRRPRIREAAEDEDDQGAGTWVIRADEPQESVEDPFGLQRPADRADDADPDGLGDSLSDLPEARVVRTPGKAREVLRSGDEVPRASGVLSGAPGGAGIAYPEWDTRQRAYRPRGAIVRERAAPPGDAAWVAAALERNKHLVRRVRARFERLRPRRTRIGRQPDGPEPDLDAYITAAADTLAGGQVDDRLYVNSRPARRELSVALLLDVSASTDSWIAGGRRIVDVEKDALLVVCEALDALGDPHAIVAFSGEGPEDVSVARVKGFDEAAGEVVRRRIGALEPDRYTRIGAAIRHVTAALSRERTGRRLLLVLSDGKPNDVDVYEGVYGVEDARQAVAESRAEGVHLFCLTVDREAPRYATRIFGPRGFALLRRPDQLPAVLVDVLRRLIRA